MNDPLLEAGERRFQQAVDAAGAVHVQSFRVAGRRLELRFAGEALVSPTCEALAHLRDSRQPRGTPDLVVHAWDSASTGVAFPVPGHEARLGLAAWRRRGSWRHQPHQVPEGVRVMHQPSEDTVTVLGAGTAVYWAADAGALPFYERAAPLVHLLHWWLASQGRSVVHAACVGGASSGALLVGASGAGKSTVAAACMASGFAYLADDYTAVASEGRPRAWSLFCSCKLPWSRYAYLAEGLGPVAAERVEPDRAMLFLDGGTAREVELDAVVMPRCVPGERSRLVPLHSRMPALAAMAPSTMLQLPGAGSQDLGAMRRLCETVPAYALEVGSDLHAVPDLLASALA